MAIHILGAVTVLHLRLLGAAEGQQKPPIANAIETAMAEGRKQRNTGNFGKALSAFERAAQEALQAGDIDLQAKALLSSSGCQIRLFQYRAAVESSSSARQLASLARDYPTAGAASGNLSGIYYRLGDFPLASEEAAKSVKLLKGSPRLDYLTQALINQGDILWDREKVAGARESFQQAIAVAHESGNPKLEATAWDEFGISLLDHVQAAPPQNSIGEAESALLKAAAMREAIHDQDGLAFTKEHLAELEFEKGNYPAALKLVDQAFAFPSLSFKTNPQYYPIHVRGRILLALGRKFDALSEFRRAVDSADLWRQGALPGDATSTRTVAYLHDVYQDYTELAAELALQNRDRMLARQALEALAKNRAASLREQLTLALGRNLNLPARYFELLSDLQSAQAGVTLSQNPKEEEAKLREIRLQLGDLENKIGLAKGNPLGPQEINGHSDSLNNIQERLSYNEVLLSFCLGKNKSFLWALTGDRVNLYQLPNESEIGKQAHDFSRQIQDRGDSSSAGQTLAGELFGKLSADALQKRDWLIAADGVLLNSIPFCALPGVRGSTGTLVANHTLRFLPSELLIASPKAAMPRPRFLGIADPIYNLADGRRTGGLTPGEMKRTARSLPVARLVGSDQEVRSAAKASRLPQTQLLMGPDATSAALRAAVVDTLEILHFAVHVISPEGQPQEAALALSLTKDGLPELLTPEAIATYHVPGSLVILSGCSSGMGKTLPSAGLIGLSRAWLLAGASAVIVSGWSTPDDSGTFFSSFYTHLRAIKSGSPAQRAAISLQETQLEMQRGSGYRSNSSFWAAYSIISKE